MRIDTVAQLLRPQTISPKRLADALRIAAPRALQTCCMPRSRLRQAQLCDAVVGALPAALAVGVAECICHRWWPTQDTNASAADAIAWTLQPRLEWLQEGMPFLGVTVVATVRLAQQPLHVMHDAAAGSLSVGEDRAWIACLSLAVSDVGSEPVASVFSESRCEVHLPRGPWLVGLDHCRAPQAAPHTGCMRSVPSPTRPVDCIALDRGAENGASVVARL